MSLTVTILSKLPPVFVSVLLSNGLPFMLLIMFKETIGNLPAQGSMLVDGGMKICEPNLSSYSPEFKLSVPQKEKRRVHAR